MHKLTKIVATVSDLRCEQAFLQDLFKAGVNVVRLNTAHQTEADTLKVIKNVRAVSKTVPLLLDTKGPEIRTTKGDQPIHLKKGSIVQVKGSPNRNSTAEKLYVSYDHFATDVPVGSHILIDDGEIDLIVKEKKDGALMCAVQNDGVVSGRKSVNIPGVRINLPSLSTKDRSYIKFAIKHDLDFIAHSFVRNKEDVLEIQRMLDKAKSKAKIIAKIENEEGVRNLQEILDHVYGIMVARGDLGIEIPAAKIPIIQKSIIKQCVERNKPVITATQMLHTMIKNPRPTRAEVSDIANAIYDGTDALMLSGETAYGEYPLQAVRTMTAIAHEIEAQQIGFKDIASNVMAGDRYLFLAQSVARSSAYLPIKAFLIDTMEGKTARRLSSFRTNKPIYTQCANERVTRELALSYGVYAETVKLKPTTEGFIKHAMVSLTKRKLLHKDDMVSILAGHFRKGRASFVEIAKVKDWLE